MVQCNKCGFKGEPSEPFCPECGKALPTADPLMKVLRGGWKGVKQDLFDWIRRARSERAEVVGPSASQRDISRSPSEKSGTKELGVRKTNYCPDCGTELNSDAQFCPNCGIEITKRGMNLREPVSAETDAPRANPTDAEERLIPFYKPSSSRIGGVGVVFGFIVGFFGAWALSGIGSTGIGFVIGFLIALIFVWQEQAVASAIGTGLYVTALAILLVPLLIYTPLAFGGGGTGEALGGVLGLLVWGFIFMLFSFAVAGSGYLLKKMAS